MNLFALILAAGTFRLSTAASPVHSQMVVNPTCRTDVDAPGFVQQMQVLILRVAPEQLSRYGFVPTDTSTVALVTDEATCTQAVTAYNAYRQANPPPDGAIVAASLYVVRVGPTRYALVDPAAAIGHFMNYFVFDSSWGFVANFAG